MSTQVSPNRFYGSRGRLKDIDAGLRRVAPTFGKALFLTHSEKSSGLMTVESDAERLIVHMLTLDPNVRTFQSQPFTVDLIDRRIYREGQQLTEARTRHKGRRGQKFYTPDFWVNWHPQGGAAVEVKIEGYEGDSKDMHRVQIGREVILASGMGFVRAVLPKSRRSPLKANLPLLVKAMGRLDLWPDRALIESVEAALESGVGTVHDLCKTLKLDPNLVPALLVSGVLSARIGRQLINGAMEIAPAYGDLGHLSLLKEVAT